MYSIGVDLGGTKIKVGLINNSGHVLKSIEVPTNASFGLDHVLDTIEKNIKDLIPLVNSSEIIGIGIGSPGPLNPISGVVIHAPTLPGWRNVPIRQLISQKIGLPTFLENDANAAALAEYIYGAGRGTRHMIYVTVSTGIGSGIIIDGQLYHGESGSAGEMGHMLIDPSGEQCNCGSKGCLESLSSGTAISKAAFNHYGRSYNASQLHKRATNGDKKAEEILEKSIYFLAIGLVNVIQLFEPDRIVIGGGVSLLGKPFFERLNANIQSLLPSKMANTLVIPAELGRDSGMLGAATIPFQKLIVSNG